MNIGFIVHGYPSKTSGGGAGSYVQLVAHELVRRRHAVFVITSYSTQVDSCGYVDHGVRVFPLKLSSWHYWFSKIPFMGKLFARAFRSVEHSLMIWKQIKEIDSHYPVNFLETVEAGNLPLAFQRRIPYVVKLHGSNFTVKKFFGEEITFGDVFDRQLERFVIRKARAVTSPSRFLAEEIERECGLKKKVIIQPYPLDPICLQDVLPAKGGKFIVLYAGRLEKKKGVHLLINAAIEILKDYKDIFFEFYGGETSDYSKEAIQEIFENKHFEKNVTVSTHIAKPDLIKKYSEAEIIVLPSAYDTSPNVIYEAMACGKPVIATNVGGIPELVDDGVTGMLVPYGDVAAICNAVIRLYNNTPLRKEMGLRAREKSIQKYSLKTVVDKQIIFYENIAKGALK